MRNCRCSQLVEAFWLSATIWHAFAYMRSSALSPPVGAPSIAKPPSSGSSVTLSIKSGRSEEHTSELQSLMRISYAVFCLKKKKKTPNKLDIYDITTTYDDQHENPQHMTTIMTDDNTTTVKQLTL